MKPPPPLSSIRSPSPNGSLAGKKISPWASERSDAAADGRRLLSGATGAGTIRSATDGALTLSDRAGGADGADERAAGAAAAAGKVDCVGREPAEQPGDEALGAELV